MRRDLLGGRVILDGADQFEIEELARRMFIDEAAYRSNADFWFNVTVRFLETRRDHKVVRELLVAPEPTKKT